MSSLFPCPGCDRHVRATDAGSPCPFCSATLPAELSTREVPGGRWRSQRITAAALATSASLVALACSNSVAMYGAPCVDNCMIDPPDAAAGDARLLADVSVGDGSRDAAVSDALDAAEDATDDAPADGDVTDAALDAPADG